MQILRRIIFTCHFSSLSCRRPVHIHAGHGGDARVRAPGITWKYLNILLCCSVRHLSLGFYVLVNFFLRQFLKWVQTLGSEAESVNFSWSWMSLESVLNKEIPLTVTVSAPDFHVPCLCLTSSSWSGGRLWSGVFYCLSVGSPFITCSYIPAWATCRALQGLILYSEVSA